MVDSIDSAHGNIIKNGFFFIHTFPAGSDNVFVGTNAGNLTMTGGENSGFGAFALDSVTTGTENTACGASSLASNTAGSANTACGASSLTANTTGNANTACGFSSLVANTAGVSNTAIGANALNATITGNGNIAFGANAGSALTSSESNNIYIGNTGVASESNAIRIGAGAQTACFIQGINGVTVAGAAPVVIGAAGQLGTIISSRRFKHDINAMANDSANIYELNPVTFAYNGDESETKQFGLIAEEVDQVLPEIVVRDEDGNPYTVQYQVLPVLLLNELKKLAAHVGVLTARVGVLENRS
jgi:hypothetical protein